MKIFLVLVIALFAQSVPAIDSLDAWYCGYNQSLFSGELPRTTVVNHNLHDDRFMALTMYNDSGRFYEITLNPKYEVSPKQGRMNLLHEMCHLRQMSTGEVEFDDHGKKWQACMHDLANKNAFEDLW